MGKRASKHLVEQTDIHALLIEHARSGRIVVRLKGGDPFVFGRGAEEVAALVGAGVPWELVPGVSSAWAAPGAVGIPVTHRALSGAVTLVTGHDAATGRHPVSWHGLAGTDHTLVIFMGIGRLAEICQRLTEAGRPASTPVAVIQEATTPRQRHAVGTLADIADRVLERGIVAPATVIVGRVVTLANPEEAC